MEFSRYVWEREREREREGMHIMLICRHMSHYCSKMY
jgi:hypothetical protein